MAKAFNDSHENLSVSFEDLANITTELSILFSQHGTIALNLHDLQIMSHTVRETATLLGTGLSLSRAFSIRLFTFFILGNRSA